MDRADADIPWPLRPKPLPDELLSSWLVRLADAHCQKLRTFTSLAWPGRTIWNGDPDRSADDGILATLARRTLTSTDAVRATTLGSYEGVLFEARSANGKMRWVLPLGLHPRTRVRRGVPFCVLCLRSDEEPYFRRTWRLAFATVCSTHSVRLFDRCPRCDAVVLLHRGDMGHKGRRVAEPMSVCHVCREDFRAMDEGLWAAPAPSTEVVVGQAELERAVCDRWAEVPGHGPTPVLLYFAGLRQIATLVLGRAHGQRLRDAACERYGFDRIDLALAPRQREIEYHGGSDRYHALRLVFAFLQDWPAGFVEVCAAARVWEHSATENMRTVPYWYWSAVHEHLDRSDYVQSVEEIAWSIAKNEEVLGGLYFPPHGRIRFTPIWNAAGVNVSPWVLYTQRRAAAAAARAKRAQADRD